MKKQDKDLMNLRTEERVDRTVLSRVVSHRTTAAAFLIITALLLFSSGLSSEFVWDDKIMLKKEVFNDWKNLGSIFLMADTVVPGDNVSYYRPVPYVTFLFDTQVWKLDPFWYNLENILLHALAAVLFYLLLYRVFSNGTLAFAASLMYLVHPAVTECVNLIVSRNTILCAVFSFAALLLLAHSGEGRRRWAVFSLLAYFLALLSKEQALVIPLFLLAATVLFRSGEFKTSAYVLSGFFIVTALYLFLRMQILGAAVPAVDTGVSGEKAGIILNSLFEYFRIMLYPFNLQIEYVALPAALFSVKSAAAVAGLTVLMILSVKKGVSMPLRAAAAWLFVSFLPVSNIVPLPSAPVADRYVYMALPGMCLAAGYIFTYVYDRKPLPAVSGFLICIVLLTVLTYGRNNVWKTEESLWLDVVEKSPGNAVGYYNLGVIYKERGFPDRAVQQYLFALERDPAYVLAHVNLGIIYHSQGRIKQAIGLFQDAINAKPDFPRAYYNLGLAYHSQGYLDMAIEQYRKAIELNPEYSQAYNNMGSAYKAKGNIDEAVKNYKSAVRFNPKSSNAHNNLGTVYRSQGLIDQAIAEFSIAVELDPGHTLAVTNLQVTKTLKTYMKQQKAVQP